jgi:polyphosphate kinase 2
MGKKKKRDREAARIPTMPTGADNEDLHTRLTRKAYEEELLRLQIELVAVQEWIRVTGARVVVVFEGRDAAGKGGTITRITQYTSPRVVKVVALPTPSDRERGQWYFQRYIEHLPARGEMVIFDRSWYNRAGVEHVLGFCTDDEYELFLKQCPAFERMLVEDGIILIKYWMSVSEDEQERRFRARLNDPLRQWKLSTTDLQSRNRWVDFSRAKDAMFAACDIPEAPWWIVESDDKRAARINCISDLLTHIPYEHVKWKKPDLPERQEEGDYVRPPRSLYRHVPDVASQLAHDQYLSVREAAGDDFVEEG